jgi:hypothetical protein
MVVVNEVNMTARQRSWPILKRYPAIFLVGPRKRKEYVQDESFAGRDRHKELHESKSEKLELETRTLMVPYRKVAHTFLLLH